MATEERDHTDDWIVPEELRPPSALELQRQIEVAMGVAYAAEEAAMEIGESSIEAARQARRAAVHAERSAEAAVAAARAAAADAAVVRSTEVPPSFHAGSPGSHAVDGPPIPETASGHEAIPGSELPAGWSPVAPAAGSAAAPTAGSFASAPNGSVPPRPARPGAQPDPLDERMIAFRERAERVMARLRALQPTS